MKKEDLLAILAEHANSFVRQIAGIRLHLGDEVLLDQRGRHRPKRIEIDLGRFRLHDRRLAVDLADAGGVMRIDDAVFDGLDGGGGNIHHDEAGPRIGRIGFQPNDIGLKLLQARFGGHVQFRERGLVDNARLAEAVAGLEVFDSRFDERIKMAPASATGSRSPEATRRARNASTALDLEPTSRFGTGRCQILSRRGRRDPDISG